MILRLNGTGYFFRIVMPALLILSGCQAVPKRMDEHASDLGLMRQVLGGTDFNHVIYRNHAVGRLLHVYLDGDGTPWLNRYAISPDPTPHNPLVLNLMAQDETSSLYLGRPCYHGQAMIPPCNPLMWTSRRYGPEVVDSMAMALKRFLKEADHEGLVFIGYSGGGTLAMLLAERFPATRAVVTIAGNLNPDRWAAWHGYSPLLGSLNPATRPPLRMDVAQLHFIGGKDRTVPPDLIDGMENPWLNVKPIIFSEFNHICCWEKRWSSLLECLRVEIGDHPRVKHRVSP